MMKATVVRAYVGSQAALLHSQGMVYVKGQWAPAPADVVTVPGRYERWCDVPAAWLGHTPWWK